MGGVSGCRNRLDILHPRQSDGNLCFPGARGFCNGLAVDLDVRDALFKLLLKKLFLFGVAFHEHGRQQAPCHGRAPKAEENGPGQLARVQGPVKLHGLRVHHHEVSFAKCFDFGGHQESHCQDSQSENHEDGAGDESDLGGKTRGGGTG